LAISPANYFLIALLWCNDEQNMQFIQVKANRLDLNTGHTSKQLRQHLS
jgi:hypothetical protein